MGYPENSTPSAPKNEPRRERRRGWKQRRDRGRGFPAGVLVLYADHVGGLFASVLILHRVELDDLSFVQRAEAVGDDRGMMDEELFSRILLNEPVTLGLAEPLD
jgi:hypothetical protein